jgi:hypothetical protein
LVNGVAAEVVAGGAVGEACDEVAGGVAEEEGEAGVGE